MKSKPFPELLKAKRGKRTQKEAAHTLGVPLKSYVNWEQGRYAPDRLKAIAILEHL